MPAPSITSIVFDKPGGYNPGDTITATVVYVPGTAPKTFTFTGTVTDSASGGASTATGTFSVNQPDATTVSAQDTGTRNWVKKSDSGTVAVFTATA